MIDLAEQVKIKSPRRKRVAFDMPDTPAGYETRLRGLYMRAVRVWTMEAARSVIAEYTQTIMQVDSMEGIRATLSSLDLRTVSAILDFTNGYRSWADDLSRAHFSRLLSRVKYATGIDLSSQIMAGDSTLTIEAMLQRNVGLVRSISDQARERIAQAVYAGVTNRTPVAQIAREIRAATGMASARARRVASDQTAKMTAALDGERMQELGAPGYEWMHSDKLHYRPEHKARDGKFIKFGSEIDRTDPPGYAPFCGCKRRMVLDI